MKTLAAACCAGLLLMIGWNSALANNDRPDRKDRAAYEQAHRDGLAFFQEACKSAGSTKPAATTRVPGIRLHVPAGALSFERGHVDRNWAFAGMPRERMGERFIASFLDFTFSDSDLHPEFGARTGMTVTMMGFQAVDVLQPDGTYLRYRLKGKSPSEGMVSEAVARNRAFRHVVSVEPLDVPGDRRHWVGGSRIRVVDGDTGATIGEVRSISFAYPPEGVKASALDKRSWSIGMTCPKYLDIQSAMTRMSLMGIIDPPRYAPGPVAPVAAALQQAVEKGLLKEASWADVDAWQTAFDAARPKDSPKRPASNFKPSRSSPPSQSYVVLKAFALPAGMTGAHSAHFYVPKGVPPPTGDPGHSAIYDFNTMTCAGAICGKY